MPKRDPSSACPVSAKMLAGVTMDEATPSDRNIQAAAPVPRTESLTARPLSTRTTSVFITADECIPPRRRLSRAESARRSVRSALLKPDPTGCDDYDRPLERTITSIEVHRACVGAVFFHGHNRDRTAQWTRHAPAPRAGETVSTAA